MTRNVTITSPHGLHLRPIRAFVELANQYSCEVSVCKGPLRVNGKSAIHLLGLEALPGTELLLEVTGPEEGRAIDVLAEALGRVFPDD
jgi:phosphotransferase system HPr (HPr) family protein